MCCCFSSWHIISYNPKQSRHWNSSRFKAKEGDWQVWVSSPQVKTLETSTPCVDWVCVHSRDNSFQKLVISQLLHLSLTTLKSRRLRTWPQAAHLLGTEIQKDKERTAGVIIANKRLFAKWKVFP